MQHILINNAQLIYISLLNYILKDFLANIKLSLSFMCVWVGGCEISELKNPLVPIKHGCSAFTVLLSAGFAYIFAWSKQTNCLSVNNLTVGDWPARSRGCNSRRLSASDLHCGTHTDGTVPQAMRARVHTHTHTYFFFEFVLVQI